MDSKAKVILNRKGEWINRLRSYKVFIDDQPVGTIRNGGTEEFSVNPGIHKMICKINWTSSREYEFEVEANQKIFLQVKSGLRYYPYMAIILIALVLYNFFLKYSHSVVPESFEYIFLGIGIPILLYLLYYTTLGRKDYLVLGKDSSSPFSS
jgi:hypothetical protein